MKRINHVKLVLLLTIIFTQLFSFESIASLFSFESIASSNGGDSERQSPLAIDGDRYTVLSIERLGHFTHYQFTNRISLKRYSLKNNKLLTTDVVMEPQINSRATYPPDSTVVTGTDTQLTSMQEVLGAFNGGFTGYIRTPKHRLKVNSDGIFMDKNGSRTLLITAEQLRLRIPHYLELAEYNAFEVIGIQGSANSHYFVVVRSNTWGIDTGSFELVLAIPNP